MSQSPLSSWILFPNMRTSLKVYLNTLSSNKTFSSLWKLTWTEKRNGIYFNQEMRAFLKISPIIMSYSDVISLSILRWRMMFPSLRSPPTRFFPVGMSLIKRSDNLFCWWYIQKVDTINPQEQQNQCVCVCVCACM